MGSWGEGEEERIATSEPVPIEDVFVSGLAGIEHHGDWVRAEFVVRRETAYGPASVVVARLTMTTATLSDVIAEELKAMAGTGRDPALRLSLS